MNEFNYEAWVEKCYSKKLDQEIDNANKEHAFFLFEKLLDKAVRDKEDVKIISNQLFANFYERLIEKVQKIIDNGKKVEIIVETDIDNGNNNKFYSKFREYISKASNFDELPNFIVVGNNSYRYETDKDSIKAVANFNDPAMGTFINKLFVDIQNKLV